MGKRFADIENLELFQQYINGAMNKINSSIDKKVDEKFISFIEDNVSDGEILDARGTERTLGIRLNKLDDRINKLEARGTERTLGSSVQIGKLLTWSGNNASKTLTGISSIYVPSDIVSRLENVDGGVEGQIVSIVSDGSLTVNHNREDWGNIRTSTSSDVILEKGIVYTLTKINELWYLK